MNWRKTTNGEIINPIFNEMPLLTNNIKMVAATQKMEMTMAFKRMIQVMKYITKTKMEKRQMKNLIQSGYNKRLKKSSKTRRYLAQIQIYHIGNAK